MSFNLFTNHVDNNHVVNNLLQDPFNMKPQRGPPGTKDKPTEVLSIYEDRIIGCVCKCP